MNRRLLLLWGRASLEGHLLGCLLLLELLGLLTRETSILWLQLRLLSKALRLTREACKLWLHWATSKAGRLGHQPALEAAGLLELLLLLLLLLAILRLPGSGAVAAP